MEVKLPRPIDVFKAVLGVRLLSAVWNIITDCDETFNYWEPMHFLLTGRGFQTWEYAPHYGLRSYLYIWLYALPGWLAHSSGVVTGRGLFFLTRVYMGGLSAAAETYLYAVLRRRYRSLAAGLPLYTLIFLSFSAGSFIASTAFLPSSFAMYLSTVLLGAWIDRSYKLAVGCVAASAVIGWPFSAALGLPLALDMIFARRRLCQLAQYAVCSGLLVSLPLLLVDYYHFGRLVLAPLNILLYNVLGSAAQGSHLYGTAPWTFYFKNYLLNFNLAFLLSLAAPFLLLFVNAVRAERKRFLMFLSPYLVWNAIFLSQPHKEERFLYPVYPFLALGAGLSATCLTDCLTASAWKKRRQLVVRQLAHVLRAGLVLGFLLLSACRIMTLVLGYGAPMRVYGQLTELNRSRSSANPGGVLCIGREWYRFPSHFFVETSWSVKLIQSEFRGQLPDFYDNRWGNATRLDRAKDFNDRNAEVASRYWPVDRCDVLVDRESAEGTATQFEPLYSSLPDWEVVASWAFLDAENSPAYARAFYIPGVFWTKNRFVSYQILRRKV